MAKDVNVYKVDGAWIREVLGLDGRWFRVGVYGSRAAAIRG